VAKQRLFAASTVERLLPSIHAAIAILWGQIRMAQVIVTVKIMPESPDSDLKAIEETSKKQIAEFGGEVGKVEIEPIAFGLNALKLFFVMDESKGDTEPLENTLKNIEQVQSVEVTDVRRAIG